MAAKRTLIQSLLIVVLLGACAAPANPLQETPGTPSGPVSQPEETPSPPSLPVAVDAPTTAPVPTVTEEDETDQEVDELPDEAFEEEDRQARLGQMVDELVEQVFDEEEDRQARLEQMVDELLDEVFAEEDQKAGKGWSGRIVYVKTKAVDETESGTNDEGYPFTYRPSAQPIWKASLPRHWRAWTMRSPNPAASGALVRSLTAGLPEEPHPAQTLKSALRTGPSLDKVRNIGYTNTCY